MIKKRKGYKPALGIKGLIQKGKLRTDTIAEKFVVNQLTPANEIIKTLPAILQIPFPDAEFHHREHNTLYFEYSPTSKIEILITPFTSSIRVLVNRRAVRTRGTSLYSTSTTTHSQVEICEYVKFSPDMINEIINILKPFIGSEV